MSETHERLFEGADWDFQQLQRIHDACQEIAEREGPVVVAYVLGTECDPQGLEAQRARLRQAGCVVAPTAARAALAAAALARRQPQLVEKLP